MAENSQRIPNVLLQPASVDFIQKRLPTFHPAFQGFENLQYDHTSNHFVSRESKMPSTQKLKAQRAAGRNLVVPVRKLVPAISAMEFWNRILTKAMFKFKAENTNMPKNLVKKPDYAIRDLTSWVDIHKNFQRAKTVYDGNNSGVSRVTKRIYRYVADNSEVLKVVTNFVPDGTYVTPVKTAIEGIVDILQTAAKVRELVRSSFEDDALEKSFAKVEIYLATFPKDENIEIASVALIACVLKAVELAIAFLLSSTGKRTAKSLLGGLLGDYMQELADSISDISQKTQDVIDTANDSNIVGTREAMDLSLEAIEELLLLEVETEERVKIIATKADLIIEQEGKVILALSSLTSELQNQFQQHATTLKQAMEEVAERNRLALANEFGEMLAALEKRRDAKDAREAEEAKKARDAQDAKDAQTLQLLSSLDQQMQDLKTSRPATPVPPQQHPPTWPSPSQPPALYPSQWLPVNSQALYQQWAMPISYNYSRLDLSGSPYPASQWTTPIPLAEQILGADDLLQVLNVSGMDREDLEEILGSSDSVDLKYRLRTRAIVRTDEFQCWLTTPESRELLIQGDRCQEPVQQRNAVSLVVASLMETLRSRDRYISLVFFCRRHMDIDDTCAYAGPAAMIRSFIAQLLMQSYQGYSFACSDLDLEGIHAGDVAALCALLEWLVKYLPEKEKRKMLVCIADGIDAYENGEEEDDLRKIIDSIVGLSRSEDSDRVVKVLATSPFGTVSIDEAFEHAHSSFLSMNSLQIVSYAEDALEFEEVTDE